MCIHFFGGSCIWDKFNTLNDYPEQSVWGKSLTSLAKMWGLCSGVTGIPAFQCAALVTGWPVPRLCRPNTSLSFSSVLMAMTPVTRDYASNMFVWNNRNSWHNNLATHRNFICSERYPRDVGTATMLAKHPLATLRLNKISHDHVQRQNYHWHHWNICSFFQS